ncbi:MAG: SNF2 family DNA or RNA helicase [Flavobacterium sp.]|jgi:SNF2 family DNA or RNA helicase
MSVTQRLANNFPDKIQTRGKQYFLSGAVQITGQSSSIISSRVHGSSEYQVMLKYEDTFNLAVDCECPYFCYEDKFCKHIWATILDAERTGFLTVYGTSNKPIYIVATYDDDMATFSPDSLSIESETAWQHLMAGVKLHSKSLNITPYRLTQRLHYFLDVSKSIANNMLFISVCQQERKKGSKWSKPKILEIEATTLEALSSEEDKEVLGMLVGAQVGIATNAYTSRYFDRKDDANFTLPYSLQEKAMRAMCSTGNCTVQISKDLELPLTWDDEGAWEFELSLERQTNDGFQLSGYFARGTARLNIDRPHLVLQGGLLFVDNFVSVLQDHAAYEWIYMLRNHGNIDVPKDELMAFVAALHDTVLPPIQLPEEAQLERRDVKPEKYIYLSAPPSDFSTSLTAEIKFKYVDELIAANANKDKILLNNKRIVIHRDLKAEKHAFDELYDLEMQEPPKSAALDRVKFCLTISQKKLSTLLPVLLKRHWHVEAEGKVYRQAISTNIKVKSGIDWFEVDADVKFDKYSATMPAILKAIKNGDTTVTLGDGSIGMLPEDWLRQYGALVTWGKTESDHISFSKQQVVLLDALLAEQPNLDLDSGFKAYRQQVEGFQGVRPLAPPEGFRGTLRDYQTEGLGWLVFLNDLGFGGCLADDMGLGKTIQVLALLLMQKLLMQKLLMQKARTDVKRTSLIVLPRSLVFNWVEEVKKFTPALRVLEHTEAERSKSGDTFKDYDIVLTTYGVLRRDITLLKDIPFNYVILDEAQAIKNSGSLAAKSARLLQADHRLAVTGTPVENHIDDLWSIFDFLNPGMLGKLNAYRALQKTTQIDKVSAEAVAKALRPFILRRTKNQVAKDLPEKTELTIFCEMKPKQKKLYEELKLHYQSNLLKKTGADGLNKSKIKILEALLRLRQAACHPGLIDESRMHEPSAKLDFLWETLSEVLDEGHKVLVFSQFTSYLSILKQQLDTEKVPYLYLDGKTRNRQAKVNSFQKDDAYQLFLISLKAGGVGLNLTRADYVFLLDPWWNPAVEAQAIDRAHRIGQTNNVFAYRLICKDTVEEKVLKLQKSKRLLAESIITADNSLVRDMSQEDLAFLLS